MNGMKMNDHFIKGSDEWKVGFIDSGTTFAYFPRRLFNLMREHFDWFCNADKRNNCSARRINKNDAQKICFHYSEEDWP
jgi:hypothetical protein